MEYVLGTYWKSEINSSSHVISTTFLYSQVYMIITDELNFTSVCILMVMKRIDELVVGQWTLDLKLTFYNKWLHFLINNTPKRVIEFSIISIDCDLFFIQNLVNVQTEKSQIYWLLLTFNNISVCMNEKDIQRTKLKQKNNQKDLTNENVCFYVWIVFSFVERTDPV